MIQREQVEANLGEVILFHIKCITSVAGGDMVEAYNWQSQLLTCRHPKTLSMMAMP